MTSNDLVRTMEADNFAFWEEFARLPGGSVGRVGDAIWYRSNIGMSSYNGVLGAGCDVDEMLARVRSWRLPARWLIGTGSAGSIEDTLRDRGLVLGDEYPAMVAAVADLPEPELNGVTIETVATDAQRRDWDDVFQDAFGLSGRVAHQVADAHAWPARHERDRVYLLLRRDGAAMATAMLHTPCDVAGVYGITVRRSCRRQGLATLATLATVRAGAERGATMAMLQASKDGFPVYQRLGFRTIGAFRSWQIP
jgi:ribosomal protein S18 acetylase RimI-like enzyme